MTPTDRELQVVVDDFLAGRLGFWSFYSTFMDLWNSASLPDDAVELWDDIYEMVYMAGPDPVSTEERRLGILGEAELKRRISERRQRTG